MKFADIAKAFGTACISQVITFLNAVFQPFQGTIFVFNGWEPIAGKSAVAIGFVVVLVIAALVAKPVRANSIIWSAVLSGVLLAACAGIYVWLSSGFAPSQTFLFWVRDTLWMLLYILMLVMVGVTIALVSLSLSKDGRSG